MYSSFHVQNFRGFEDLQFNDLGRVNLIAGKNSTGKTSLLEAIQIHAGHYEAIFSRTPYFADDANHLFFNLEIGQSIIFTAQANFSFDDDIFGMEKDKNLRLSEPLRIDIVREKYFADAFRYEEMFKEMDIESSSRIYLRFQRADQPKWTDFLVYSEGRTILKTAPLIIKIVFLPAHEIISPEIEIDRFSLLKRDKETRLLTDALRMIEPRLLDLEFLPNGIHADLEGVPKLLPLAVIGGGLARVTSIILAMNSVRDGVLLIDEIENGLHYAILEDVWKAIDHAAERFNVQVFATTHSLEVIQAAQIAFQDQDDFRYHRLERREPSGKIEVVTVKTEVLAAALENNFEVR